MEKIIFCLPLVRAPAWASILVSTAEQEPRIPWVEAAALRNQNDDMLLLTGGSYAGKTTLSLALALTGEWKILSEDIVLVDVDNECMVPFARPLSLRAGSMERIAQATGLPSKKLLDDEWYFDPEVYYYKSLPLKFKNALHLEPFTAQTPDQLAVEKISPAVYVRKILELSNLLRYPGGIELFSRSIEEADCYLLRGGQLKDRLDFVSTLF